MSSPLAHRGPDGFDSWTDGPVGFAARILQTDTTSSDERPIGRLGADTLVAVADARIDNREELAGQLGIGPPHEGIADVDLILAAYRKWGQNSPSRLIGDFAYVIWDRERRAFFCARDTIGARPFRYHLSASLFAFASESKALLALPEVPRELDEVQVAFWLDRFLDDPERTFHRGIRRLPAAHFLDVTPEGAHMEQYWEPARAPDLRLGSDEEYAEAFREVFFEAVRCRLPRTASIGAALSGGLDSSSIVCTARRLTPRDRQIHAFSAVFPGLPDAARERNDESHFIDAVAADPGIVSHKVCADEISPLADYDRVLWHHDGPPLAFNLYMRWALLAAAEREGVRVFLDGTDGDSVVSKGYERFIDLAGAGEWSAMVREVRTLTERSGSPRGWFPRHLVYPELERLARAGRWLRWLRASGEIARGLGRSRRGLVVRYGLGALLPDRVRDVVRGRGSTNGDDLLIRPDFARRTGLEERKRELQRGDDGHGMTARDNHVQVLSLPRYQYAMELIDGTASAFGIMHRFPFFDRRLVEFCVGIPPDQKLSHGWTRWILRRAMKGILPPAVQWRVDKGMLGFSFIRGMWREEAPFLEDTLFGDSTLADFVDVETLQKTHRRFLAREPDLNANADAMALYQAAVLARWLRGVGAAAAT